MNPPFEQRARACRTPRTIRRRAAACVLAATLCWAAPTPARAETEGASSFIRALGEDVVAVLKDGALDQASRREALRAIFEGAFDTKAIARFVLGRYWRVATAAQKARYLEVFPVYVADIYAGRLSGYAGEKFVVVRERPVDADRVHVDTEIRRPAGNPLQVDFRVHRTPAGFRILDAQVEGVSLLITKRDEFATVIRRKGVDGLLSLLEERTRGMVRG